MAKTTAKQAPLKLPPESLPPEDNTITTPSFSSSQWMEKPIEVHPKEYTPTEWASRLKYETRFKSDGTTTLDDWKTYVIFGFYLWDDPAKFTKMWQAISGETKSDRIARAKYIWKTYQFHTKNDLEMDTKLARYASFAQKTLSKNRSTRDELSMYHNHRDVEVEDEEETDETIDFSYADELGTSPDTIMKTASEMSDADAQIHMRPKPIAEEKGDDEEDGDDEEEEVAKEEDEEDDDDESSEDEIEFLGTKQGTKKRRHIKDGDNEDEEMDDSADMEDGTEDPDEEVETVDFDSTQDHDQEGNGTVAMQKPAERNEEEMADEEVDEAAAPRSPPKTKRVNTAKGTPDGGNKKNEQTQAKSPQTEPTDAETRPPKKSVSWIVTPIKEDKDSDAQSQHSVQSKATDDGSIASGTAKDVKVNDGTYRFQTNWATGKFEELKETGALWNRAIVPVLKQLLEHPKAFLHAWDSSDSTMVHVKDVTEFNVRKFLSPKISPSQQHKAFFFGIRVSFTEAPPQVWLAESQTKKIMKDLQIRISVSNSSCAGGELITAGYIFFKEVQNCHKHRYNQSLRMQLPPSSPHFDVIACRRTETGENVAHLAVQCGTTHVQALAEILQTHLNGATTTAVFIGRQAFMSMGKDAVKDLYRIQGEFMKSLVRIPIPMLTNIDKLRNEQGDDPKERTMREWAASLRTKGGAAMQADVENGGKDRNTYLYVPKKNEEAAKAAVKEYRETIRPFQQRQERFHARITPQGAPTNIFVPTAAATANIAWIQSFTDAESHWKQAPESVREGPGTQKKPKSKKTKQQPATATVSANESATNPDSETATEVEMDEDSMDDDITVATSATSHSGITTQMSDFETQFEEIEKTIAAQAELMQQASNQQATRMTSIEEKILASMKHNQDTNQQVTELDSKVDRLTVMIEQLTSRLAQQLDTTAGFPAVVPGLSSVASRTRNLEASKDDDESSTQTQSSGWIRSPEHKKKKPAPADDQYKSSSSAAGRKK